MASNQNNVYVVYNLSTSYYINSYDSDGVYLDNWAIEATENIGNALAVDIDNNVYTITQDQHYIKKRNSSGTLTLTKTETHWLYNIVVGADGYIYTMELKSDSSTNQISKRNTSDLEIVSSKSMGNTNFYYGMTIDTDGKLYLVNGSTHEYERWDFTTGKEVGYATAQYVFASLAVHSSTLASVDWLDHAITLPTSLDTAETDAEITDIGSPGSAGSVYGAYFLFSGYDVSSDLVLGKYDTSLTKVWTVVMPDSGSFSYGSIGSYPFAEIALTYDFPLYPVVFPLRT